MNAFISGGSRGLGRAIVLRFVQEGIGCAFSYNTNEESATETIKLAAAINPDILVKAYKMKLSAAQEIEDTVDQAIKDFSEISIVVNNAAMLRNNVAVLMSNEEWEDVIAVCLSGPFYVARSFLMHLISQRYGRIINISSIGQYGVTGQVNYAAAKSGLVGLTKTLAKEYGAKNITTNSLAIGLVETDMSKDSTSNELRELLEKYCPLKRSADPKEIVETVNFIASKHSSYINGEIINVSGGLNYVP